MNKSLESITHEEFLKLMECLKNLQEFTFLEYIIAPEADIVLLQLHGKNRENQMGFGLWSFSRNRSALYSGQRFIFKYFR